MTGIEVVGLFSVALSELWNYIVNLHIEYPIIFLFDLILIVWIMRIISIDYRGNTA